MNYLEEKIIQEGKVIGSEILKVDSFLNQKVDPKLMEKIGEDFANHFKNKNITKVPTAKNIPILNGQIIETASNEMRFGASSPTPYPKYLFILQSKLSKKAIYLLSLG